MRIAVVHYHLQAGGVSRIIHHIARGMEGRVSRMAVVCGSKPAGEWPCPVAVVPGLLYEAVRDPVDARTLAVRMTEAAAALLGGTPDIWHVHNHSLGKNLALPGALVALAKAGHRLLLHIHDFAEDGRPGNYRGMLANMAGSSKVELSRLLYPTADHIHYAVLNGRDYRFLADAGVPSSCLHRLANPVEIDVACPVESEPAEGPELWLYPTRAIRRKNIGEFLLWSLVSPEGRLFATTLGPENPMERKRYNRWRTVAQELQLPVMFEYTRQSGRSFPETLCRARALVTTSVAEGFGMAFLEPWLAGKPVCGRDLPEITNDFREDALQLPWLYARLLVPVEWLGTGRLLDAALTGLRGNMAAYGRIPSGSEEQRLRASWMHRGMVDFCRLDEPMQEEVLRLLRADPDKASLLEPPVLPGDRESAAVIEQNRRILGQRYSLRGFADRLLDIYGRLLANESSALDRMDGEVLLNHFLAPERLSLLRVD